MLTLTTPSFCWPCSKMNKRTEKWKKIWKNKEKKNSSKILKKIRKPKEVDKKWTEIIKDIGHYYDKKDLKKI